MKARVVHPAIELCAPPDQLSREWMEITEVRQVKRNGRMIPRAFWKVGAIIELPDCWMAVEMGWAEPADDECFQKSGCMTREQLNAAQRAYIKTDLGIHPDDYEKFDAGVMVGYNPDGTDKPGPNWVPEPEEPDGEEDDE